LLFQQEISLKTIGLLGGMSWESTQGYYRAINEGIRDQLGGLHSAKIAMVSVDFEPIEQMQHKGDWEGTARVLTEASQSIQSAGADFLVICTNTMHKVADVIAANINIPILHIADATAQELQHAGINRVGLLGTAFTMEQAFYKSRLIDNYGIDVIIPDHEGIQRVHEVIYNELCMGKINAQSRQDYLEIINTLATEGAEAVILGCTEIGLLVQQADTTVALFDTTAIHANAAVKMALGQ
jgi:aspartate racemase